MFCNVLGVTKSGKVRICLFGERASRNPDILNKPPRVAYASPERVYEVDEFV